MMKFRFVLIAVAVITSAIAVAPSHASDIGEDPVLVGIDEPGDGAVTGDPTLAPLGLDELAAYIHQPDYSKPELEVIWQVTDMQLSPPPPEVVRYLWQMTVDGVEYWIQAKTSDISTASATADDVPGTLTHIPGAFRLRTNCSVTGIIATCHHVKWLDGVFDSEKHEIRVTVPIGDPAAPHIIPGAHILPTNIEAGLQAAISNNSTTDQMSGCAEYVVPTNGVPGGSDGGCE